MPLPLPGGNPEPMLRLHAAITTLEPLQLPPPQRGPLALEGVEGKTAEQTTAEIVGSLVLCEPGVYYADASVVPTGDGVLRFRDGRLDRIPEAELWSRMQAAATIKVVGDDPDAPPNHESIPRKYATFLANRAGDFLPPLRAMLNAPFVTPDGAVAREPGYFPDARILLTRRSCGQEIDAQQACRAVDELLGDFVFQDPASRMAALALLIQPMVRPAIIGPSPMYAVIADHVRAGKTLLMNLAGALCTGSAVENLGLPKNAVELPYTIAAALRKRRLFIGFDNLPDDWVLASHDLERALTSHGPVEIRPASSGHNISVDASLSTWVVTANRLSLGGGMSRRVVRIRLLQQPDDKQYRFPDLLAHVLEHQPRLTESLMWFVEEWLRRGRPSPRTSFPSFPAWSRVVGGVLSVMVDQLNLGGTELVEDWLGDLTAQIPQEEAEAGLLYELWPIENLQEKKWLAAGEVVSLIQQSREHLPWSAAKVSGPPSQQGRAVAAGRWLKSLATAGQPITRGRTTYRLVARQARAGAVYRPEVM
jgi:hypothetical protein